MKDAQEVSLGEPEFSHLSIKTDLPQDSLLWSQRHLGRLENSLGTTQWLILGDKLSETEMQDLGGTS